MDNPKTQFGRNVRRLREALGLTQEALGAAAGLDRSYVGGVERGERNPSLSTIAQLARALQTPVAQAMTSSGSCGPTLRIAER